METVKTRVEAMDDFQVVRYFNAFSQQLLAGSDTSFDDVMGGIPASARSLDGWQSLEGLTPDQAQQILGAADAAETSRSVLLYLADDMSLGPVLETHLATYRDDELVVEVILAVGLVASVLLVAASVEFEGSIAGVKFKKGKADPETLKAIVGPFASVISRLLGS